MASPSRPFVIAVAAAAVLAVGALWLVCGKGDTQEPRQAQGVAHEPEGTATPVDAAQATPPSEALAAAPPDAVPPEPEPAPADAPEAQTDAAATTASAPPDDGLDGPSWRSSRLAFRPRELGKVGRYVKVGLDAARRDMAFCFRGTGGDPAPADGSDDGTPRLPSAPGILLLYIEAREGALDIIEARTERLGTATPELVECCRGVLRGRHIPAFDAMPGRRYRVKFRLQ
jgi:hypothetical protein